MAVKSVQQKAYLPGEIIDQRYQVIELIGGGAVGTVLRVSDQELDRDIVALKVLHPQLALDRTTFLRFQQEVSVCRQLSHPNIVRVYDFKENEEQNLYFISMECVHGPNLKEYLGVHKGHRLPWEDSIKILNQIAHGLSFAHKKEIVHRDVKPSNILLDTDGLAKLTDFGIAQSLQQTHGLTATGESLGTPAYMFPEHFLGKGIDARSDIYSLGIVAYEIMCGQLPFRETDFYSLAKQHLDQTPPIEPLEKAQLPSWCIRMIKRCLAKDKTDRFQSSAELIEYIAEHANNTLENPRVSLKHYTREALRARFLSKRLLYTMRIIAAIFVFSVLAVSFREEMPQARLLSSIIKTENALETDLCLLRTLLGFPEYAVHTQDALKKAISRGDYLTTNALILLNLTLRPDAEGNTLLHFAARNRHRDMLLILLHSTLQINPNIQNNDGDTVLHIAAKGSETGHVKHLLRDSSIDPNITNKQGNTALHIAALKGDRIISSTILKLSEQRLEPWKTNNMGDTPLHTAVRGGDFHLVQLMLETGIDPNLRDSEGRTSLMLALETAEANKITAKITTDVLVKAGAHIQARDNRGQTLHDYAQNDLEKDILKRILNNTQAPTNTAEFNKLIINKP